MGSDAQRTLGDDLVRAAEHGDHLAFAALVQRLGTLEEAQQTVRARAFVRMAARVALPKLVPPELRDAAPAAAPDGGEAVPASDTVLHGHLAVFNEFTEIDDIFEGHFLERIAPGAFKKTFREQQQKVLFQHGMDPLLGDKVLGKIESLAEDDVGAAYEVRLFNGLPELLIDGLRAGEYGSSFRFRVIREQFDEEPDPTDQNPKGLPERTLKEVQVPEFGPVTFPAYASATAGIRAITNADGDGEEITDAPSTADAAADAHLEATRSRADNGTSGTERREAGSYTWQSVLHEPY